MRKDQEPSIIRSAREHNELTRLQQDCKERLAGLIEDKAERKRLGGDRSALVLQSRVFGASNGINYCIEVRGSTRSFDDNIALGFSSGEFSRTFIFSGPDCSVLDTHMDKYRNTGAWIGFPPQELRREPTLSDLGQLSEAMDLFEQNVGKGVNRD